MQHSELQEQIPLYALGGMTEDESARLAEHLAVCPGCRALLSEYQFVTDELLLQVPALTAPAAVGVNLSKLAQADAAGQVGSLRRNPTASPRPASSNHRGVPEIASRNSVSRPRFWNQPIALPRWSFALGLLAVLLLLGAAGVFAFQLQNRTSTPQQVLQLLTSPNIKYVELTSGMGTPGNNGYLCVSPNNTTGLLWLYSLPALDQQHVYQVWLLDDKGRINGGTFRPDTSGRAIAVIQAPRPLTDYNDIGITIEPVMGSQWPTTPRIVGGKLD